MSRKREDALEVGAQQRQRQILVGAVGVDLAHRHGLDHRQVHAAAMRPAQHLGHFRFVEALQRDSVELDLQAGGLRRIDAGHHLVDVAPARDRTELVPVQRVQRDVDAS